VLLSADCYLAFVPLLTHARRSSLQMAFTQQSFQPFSRNFATVVRYPKPSFRNVSIRALSSYDILPITKVIGLTAMENLLQYYNAVLHVNIKIMMRCSVSLIIKSTFCSVVKSVLKVCVSVNLTCQVNTAQSNTLVHSIVTNK